MHSASSTECDLNVRACSTNLEDFDVLGKLAKGDLFTQELVYHQVLQGRLCKKRSEGKAGFTIMLRHVTSARVEQISTRASWCRRVRSVAWQFGTILNRLQVNYATRRIIL